MKVEFVFKNGDILKRSMSEELFDKITKSVSQKGYESVVNLDYGDSKDLINMNEVRHFRALDYKKEI